MKSFIALTALVSLVTSTAAHSIFQVRSGRLIFYSLA